MSSRREENANRTRAELIQAATELFGERGFQAVSIADICEAVGLSRGGFYHHFANREECFEAVWLGLQEQWGAHAAELATTYTGDDPWELVEHSFRDLFSYWAEPARRQINLYDPVPALGWERIRELQRGSGNAQVAEMLRLLGKKHDALTVRVIAAAITDATFHVGEMGDPPDLRAEAATTLIELIQGLPAAGEPQTDRG